MVGARGFEPPTSSSRTMRATKLRHAPTESARLTEPADDTHPAEDPRWPLPESAAPARPVPRPWLRIGSGRQGRPRNDDGHEPEHDRHARRLPHRSMIDPVDRGPQRPDAERQREVQGVRGVADRGRRDVARGAPGAAGSRRTRTGPSATIPTHSQGSDRPGQQEHDEPGGAAEVDADDQRLAPEPVRQPAGDQRHRHARRR